MDTDYSCAGVKGGSCSLSWGSRGCKRRVKGAFWAGNGLVDKGKHRQRLEGKKEHSIYGE